MRPLAFANDGQFFRGNLHTHSNLSDGKLTPHEVCRRYKNQGYDFIALTDHFIGTFDYPIADTRPFRDSAFTTLIGVELHSGANSLGELWHMLAIGLPFDFAPPNAPDFKPRLDQESAAEIARRAANAGAFVVIAHPEWSLLDDTDMVAIDAAHAVEIYNHGCAVECERAYGLHSADLLARTGKRVGFIATDDAHFTHGNMDAFGGWVMVKAQENTPEAILQALKDGAMYSSTGPRLNDVELDGDVMRVACSPASAVIVAGQASSTLGQFGDSLTEVEIDVSRLAQSPWLRVTVVDRHGKQAWCNPIWRD